MRVFVHYIFHSLNYYCSQKHNRSPSLHCHYTDERIRMVEKSPQEDHCQDYRMQDVRGKNPRTLKLSLILMSSKFMIISKTWRQGTESDSQGKPQLFCNFQFSLKAVVKCCSVVVASKWDSACKGTVCMVACMRMCCMGIYMGVQCVCDWVCTCVCACVSMYVYVNGIWWSTLSTLVLCNPLSSHLTGKTISIMVLVHSSLP